MYRRRICDICGEHSPRHKIPFSRRPNDEPRELEICNFCLGEVVDYLDSLQADTTST